MATLPEVWLRGPLPHIPPLLQPVAHALLQAKEEVIVIMNDFPDTCLWIKPSILASPGFHLQHLTGVLDRLFTYAQGLALSARQLTALQAEGKGTATTATNNELVAAFAAQVDASLEYLKSIAEGELTSFRAVGRAQLPSTLLGLLFHAAEHTMRHVGQLLVTVQVIKYEIKLADKPEIEL